MNKIIEDLKINLTQYYVHYYNCLKKKEKELASQYGNEQSAF